RPAPSGATVKGVDRAAGTTAQQRGLLDGRLRTAATGATGPGKALLDTMLAWDGSYNTANAAGTVDAGVAAWEALKDAAVATLPRAARSWLGSPSRSHQFDFAGGDGGALKAI